MSQERVVRMLAELGDGTTTKELRASARRQWPRETLHLYVHVQLQKLLKWRYVEIVEVDCKGGDQAWRLTEAGRTWLLKVIE
jgi:hypothetical protein